jgi:hypothetical protein
MRHDEVSARLLIRPAVRWARPVPATNDDRSPGKARPRPASESFGSVVVTGTDTGSDHLRSRHNGGESRLCVLRTGRMSILGGDKTRGCELPSLQVSGPGQPRRNPIPYQ